jgi:hypothetical protein
MSANPDDYYRAQSIKIRKEYAKEIAEYGVTMRLLSELLFGSEDYISFINHIKTLSNDSINNIILNFDYSESNPFQPIVTYAEIANQDPKSFEEFLLVSNTIKEKKIAIMKIIFGICNTEIYNRSRSRSRDISYIQIEDS